jgi:hypothetical protein
MDMLRNERLYVYQTFEVKQTMGRLFHDKKRRDLVPGHAYKNTVY